MEEEHISVLVDQYLLGKISPGDRIYLEHLIASDPEIAEFVKESKKAFAVLQFERNRLLKERLREIDKNEPLSSTFFSKKRISIAFFLVIILCSWFWATLFYRPSSIAMRSFEMMPMPETTMPNQVELEKNWQLANTAFRDGEFENAVDLYSSFVKEANLANNYRAEWNILLAQFALGGPSEDWKHAIISFSENTPEPYVTKSKKLLRFLNSPFYKFFLSRIQANLSSLKPRLI